MKSLLNLTAALICGFVIPAAAFAGPTENITGCATVPIADSNATQFVDPACHKAPQGGSGFDPLILSIRFPDAEEPANPPAEEPEEVAAE